MKEYLKMNQVITGMVNSTGSVVSDATGSIARVYGPDVYAKYVAHAINSHDELVAEVERLSDVMSGLLSLAEHFAKCGGWDVNAYAEYKKAKGA